MEIEPTINFSTKDDELRYWMSMAHQMYRRKIDVERELQEYQESSIILEKELEFSYEQTDKINRDLQIKNFKLLADNEKLKNKLNQQITAYSTLQTLTENLKVYNNQLVECVRKLEQKTDDLERANRESKVAEEEIETQYNTVLEKLALLETEVDEKEGLKIVVQQLKNENTDLKQQIQVGMRQHCKNNANKVYAIQQRNSVENENRLLINTEAKIEHKTLESKNFVQYVQKMEEKVEFLKNTNKPTPKKTNVKYNVNKIEVYESDEDEKENEAENLTNNNDDFSKAVKKSHSRKDKSKDKTRSEDKQRCFAATRHTDNRVKKAKDEDKRQQSLSWFLKRLRYSQPNWMRRK